MPQESMANSKKGVSNSIYLPPRKSRHSGLRSQRFEDSSSFESSRGSVEFQDTYGDLASLPWYCNPISCIMYFSQGYGLPFEEISRHYDRITGGELTAFISQLHLTSSNLDHYKETVAAELETINRGRSGSSSSKTPPESGLDLTEENFPTLGSLGGGDSGRKPLDDRRISPNQSVSEIENMNLPIRESNKKTQRKRERARRRANKLKSY